MPFEILHRALMLLRLFSGSERSQITPPARLRILLARIQPILARLQFPDHVILDAPGKSCDVRNLSSPSCADSLYLIHPNRRILAIQLPIHPIRFAMLDSDEPPATATLRLRALTHLFSNVCKNPHGIKHLPFKSCYPDLTLKHLPRDGGKGGSRAAPPQCLVYNFCQELREILWTGKVER
jgi:hypothetical protein